MRERKTTYDWLIEYRVAKLRLVGEEHAHAEGAVAEEGNTHAGEVTCKLRHVRL